MKSSDQNRKVYFALLCLALQMTAFSPAVSAKNFWDQKKSSVVIATMPTNFQRLRKTDSLWTVLEDAEVKKEMQTVMGAAVENYFDATQVTELPSVNGDDLYSAGGVRGLFTLSESFFDLNLANKKLCLAVLNDRALSIYGASSFEQLPAPVREYIEDLQTRIAPDKLKIQFEKPAPGAPQTAAKPEFKKHVRLGVVTGSYSRVDTDPRFECAAVKVLRLRCNKIKFSCTAFSGSHSGEASAIVDIKDNCADYSFASGADSGYKLTLRFDGKYLYVEQAGEGFGGIGVTASGTYRKVDDQEPMI